MTPSHRYSIWLRPSGEIDDELSELIARLSRQFATSAFPPHVTLLGELEGDENALGALAARLAGTLAPFDVTLTTLNYLSDYYRCLFIQAAATPALLAASDEARRIFGREQDPPFMPHLSLMYGDFDIETKQRIIASLGRGHRAEFRASALHLFCTTGDPRNWRRVQVIPLAGRGDRLNG